MICHVTGDGLFDDVRNMFQERANLDCFCNRLATLSIN